jgi:hypothetical protein
VHQQVALVLASQVERSIVILELPSCFCSEAKGHSTVEGQSGREVNRLITATLFMRS